VIVRVIPPLLHGYADCIGPVALILLPFILGFDDSTAALLFYDVTRFVLASVVGADRPGRRDGVARWETTVAHLPHMSSRRLAG
jgi:hypothetical protein